MKSQEKTPKRFELVKDYLHKICDRGHHTYYDVQFHAFPEELSDWDNGVVPSIHELVKAGRASIIERNDWDDVLKNRGRSNTVNLLRRDIAVFWAIDNRRNQEGMTKEQAIWDLFDNWRSDFGKQPKGESTVEEIYKEYFKIFHLGRNTFKDPKTGRPTWQKQDLFLNFSLRDGAAYALREEKALHNWFPTRPTGLLEEIHRILELPFEEDIEKEIPIYQAIRLKAFRVTHLDTPPLRNVSMGRFKGRFQDRCKKIHKAIEYASDKFQERQERLVTIYHHYRLIEAKANGQNLGRVFESLQKDLLLP